jgi:hypothetical protein
MSVISVITPAYNPEPEYLAAAWESLRTQDLPAGWELEWVVQEDGPTRQAEDILGADPRIVHGRGRHGGVSLARNLGLARSRGTLIKNLDQDDVLLPGVLTRDISHIDDHVAWTTSRALDLMPDGTQVLSGSDPEHGPLLPGMVLQHWRQRGHRLPVHPTTICVRRDLLVALGGWMAVPGSDDTGMLIAASQVSTGFFEGETGLLYRKWPGQAAADPGHYDPEEWNLRMSLIAERGEAIRTLLCHEAAV